MAQQVATISSRAEAEKVTENGLVDEVVLLVDAETPLQDAGYLKVRTHAGALGFRVMNPELLDCKFTAKVELEQAGWMEECRKGISHVDLLIATVKEKLAIPEDRLPHCGTPETQRNQGIYQYFVPKHLCEYPTYDYGAVPLYQAPYAAQEDIAAAIQRDRDSQRAWWKLNLEFLEAKKKVLVEKASELKEQVFTIKKTALESKSLLGAGYADYSFEHI